MEFETAHAALKGRSCYFPSKGRGLAVTGSPFPPQMSYPHPLTRKQAPCLFCNLTHSVQVLNTRHLSGGGCSTSSCGSWAGQHTLEPVTLHASPLRALCPQATLLLSWPSFLRLPHRGWDSEMLDSKGSCFFFIISLLHSCICYCSHEHLYWLMFPRDTSPSLDSFSVWLDQGGPGLSTAVRLRVG